MAKKKKKKTVKLLPNIFSKIPEHLEHCYILVEGYNGHHYTIAGIFELREEAIEAATVSMSEPDEVPEKLLIECDDFTYIDNDLATECITRIPLFVNHEMLQARDSEIVIRYE